MGESFRQRFLKEAGDKPYAWAAKYNLPKALVTAVLRGDDTYKPINRTLNLIVKNTGKSISWWLTGECEESTPHKINQSSAPYQTGPDLVVQDEEGKATIVKFKKSPPVNKDLMAIAVQALDEFVEERRLVLAPDRKGAILTFLYNYLLQEGDIEDATDILRAVGGD